MAAENTGELAIMDPTGHTTVPWTVEDTATVDAARAKFNDLVKQGYTPFKMSDQVSKEGQQIKEFDKAAERIIMVPRMVGG